jgi:hypothetical protein
VAAQLLLVTRYSSLAAGLTLLARSAIMPRVMPKWRNGRRDGLKNRWGQLHVGSTPTFGTKSHFVGAWLSLVERSVRDAEVGGSNPLAPTTGLQRGVMTRVIAPCSAPRSKRASSGTQATAKLKPTSGSATHCMRRAGPSPRLRRQRYGCVLAGGVCTNNPVAITATFWLWTMIA